MKIASTLADAWMSFKCFGMRKYTAFACRFPKQAERIKAIVQPLVRKIDARYIRYKTNNPD